MSPFSTGLSSIVIILELCSCMCPNSCSISSSDTLYSIFLISIPLYFPNSTSGFVCIIAMNFSSFPFSICVTSMSGLLTICKLLSFIASCNACSATSLNASS